MRANTERRLRGGWGRRKGALGGQPRMGYSRGETKRLRDLRWVTSRAM